VETPIDALSRFDPLAEVGGGVTLRGYVLLDVFTDAPLEGNQLAVFTDARGMDERDMQRLALELRLSESVFLLPPERGGDARARIFTPASELPFAGHPVLGAAVLVGRALGSSAVTLETGGGPVEVRLKLAGRAASGWMRQPLPTWEPLADAPALLAALGVERSLLPVDVYTNGPRHAYVQLESEREVAALAPDMVALAALDGVLANCFAGSGGHWKTRMFAPALGVPEDPATGSAAGPLALHLSRHGRVAFGQEIEISQGAEIGRPSRLHARAVGSAERLERVEVGGSAVIVGRGQLRLS
jgi:trans-2,3-dihydro-3-hydroxyanthranilate isomerase